MQRATPGSRPPEVGDVAESSAEATWTERERARVRGLRTQGILVYRRGGAGWQKQALLCEAGPTWAEQGRAPGSRMRGLRTQGSLDYGGRGRGGSSSRHSQTRNPNPRNQRNPGKHSEERGGVQRGPGLGRAGGRFRVLRGGGTQSAYSSDLPETRTQTLDTDTRPRKKPRKNPTSQKPETAETPLRIGARCVDPRDVEGPSRM